jgi:Domain of unknown function (DUF4124)
MLLIALASPAAHAATLYKCVGASGLESIQSDPCRKGETQLWKRDATPEAPLSPEQAAALQARRDRESADARAMSEVAGTSRAPAPVVAPPPPAPPVVAPVAETPKGPCRRAHEFSVQVRSNDWLDMRDDQLRRLDSWVAEQCRDPQNQ